MKGDEEEAAKGRRREAGKWVETRGGGGSGRKGTSVSGASQGPRKRSTKSDQQTDKMGAVADSKWGAVGERQRQQRREHELRKGG